MISVACNPTAIITSDTVCHGDTTRINGALSISGGTDSIIAGGLYEPYTWQNSGGNAVSPFFDDTIMYIFNNSGIQDSTRLITINTHGCSDTSWHRSYVRANPIAGIDWSSVNSNFCRNDSITFVSSNGNNPNSQIFGSVCKSNLLQADLATDFVIFFRLAADNLFSGESLRIEAS